VTSPIPPQSDPPKDLAQLLLELEQLEAQAPDEETRQDLRKLRETIGLHLPAEPAAAIHSDLQRTADFLPGFWQPLGVAARRHDAHDEFALAARAHR
jgi:hypothetical protein